MRLLTTGGCGFIGSAVIRHLICDTDHSVIKVDAMTYAASEDALEAARQSNRHQLIRADIADELAMAEIFAAHQPDFDRPETILAAFASCPWAYSDTGRSRFGCGVTTTPILI